MPDLYQLVDMHGSIKKYRIELVLEHSDGFAHKVASASITSREGFSADDMHRELIKTAEHIAVANIHTDDREKRARSNR